MNSLSFCSISVVTCALACLLTFNVSLAKGSVQVDSLFNATMNDFQTELVSLTDSMMEAKVERNRYIASYDFIKILVQALKTENSFDYRFKGLDMISIMYPEDRAFRIFSWQIQNRNGTYRHFGAIQMNERQLKLFALVDASDFTEAHDIRILDKSNWYGCVYYHIERKEYKGQKFYHLFGWDGNDVFSNKKLIDVLVFDSSGEPKFGAPLFTRTKQDTRRVMRFILEYKENAQPSLNYNSEEDMIVYDNLIPLYEESVGVASELVPDGSYRGMKFEKGYWRHIEKVYRGAYEKAPVPNPVDFD